MKVERKQRENTSSMLRRFTKKVKRSGILLDVKKSQTREKEQSRTERRKKALERNRRRKEKTRLKKQGRA
ncbi:MAG: hypothetical protein GF387_02290 [Candidatus Portnoybacteria bacterium]|nr:hypothetical protein [Candidatus Portnoybacteria bacterium]